MGELTQAMRDFSEVCVDWVGSFFKREDPNAYRVRWTYVTRDKDWAKLLEEQPELHELAHPNVVDLALDTNGDHVFMPTPDGGVTMVLVIQQGEAEHLIEAWHAYQEYDGDDWDEDSDEESAGDVIDNWTYFVMEHIESALDDASDTWESERD